MSIRGRKPKKGSLGTSFIIEKVPGLKRISCSNCINYNVDKSCDVKISCAPFLFFFINYFSFFLCML